MKLTLRNRVVSRRLCAARAAGIPVVGLTVPRKSRAEAPLSEGEQVMAELQRHVARKRGGRVTWGGSVIGGTRIGGTR